MVFITWTNSFNFHKSSPCCKHHNYRVIIAKTKFNFCMSGCVSLVNGLWNGWTTTKDTIVEMLSFPVCLAIYVGEPCIMNVFYSPNKSANRASLNWTDNVFAYAFFIGRVGDGDGVGLFFLSSFLSANPSNGFLFINE